MIFEYVSSCLASEDKLWNFVTQNADDYLYVCTTGEECRINSTLYIPYFDSICIDFRNYTY